MIMDAVSTGGHLAVGFAILLFVAFVGAVFQITVLAQAPNGWTALVAAAAALMYLFVATKGFGGLRR